MIRICLDHADVRTPFNVDGGAVSGKSRQFLYLRESFCSPEPTTNPSYFYTRETQGCFDGLLASERPPLARKYCT